MPAPAGRCRALPVAVAPATSADQTQVIAAVPQRPRFSRPSHSGRRAGWYALLALRGRGRPRPGAVPRAPCFFGAEERAGPRPCRAHGGAGHGAARGPWARPRRGDPAGQRPAGGHGHRPGSRGRTSCSRRAGSWTWWSPPARPRSSSPRSSGCSWPRPVTALNQAKLVLGTRRTGRLRPAGRNRPEADPPEGTEVAEGSTVNLEVSSGKVKVPKVVGQTEAQARADHRQLRVRRPGRQAGDDQRRPWHGHRPESRAGAPCSNRAGS